MVDGDGGSRRARLGMATHAWCTTTPRVAESYFRDYRGFAGCTPGAREWARVGVKVRNGLAAGGKRIRTLGPAVKSTAVPRRAASFRAGLNRLGAVPIPGGTESSNPLSSSVESAANLPPSSGRPTPELAVGEGIETCLAYVQVTGIPAWAALSSSGLMAVTLPPLPMAETVNILVDLDPAGEQAALVAAQRFDAEGRRVNLVRPNIGNAQRRVEGKAQRVTEEPFNVVPFRGSGGGGAIANVVAKGRLLSSADNDFAPVISVRSAAPAM
jgi:Toprim domain